tara:strand:- start:6053 stop:6607 length:555 start_codon:yes stop_codon:yes gene_type:complete
MDQVKEGADKLIEKLSDPAMQDDANKEQALESLRATAEQYVDFRLATMYSIGKPWLKMSKQMQDDLTEAFVNLLQRTYLQRIPAYGGQKVNYVKEIIQGRKAKVFTEIIDKDKTISIEFRLRDNGQQWMIYDVVAEGVSMVSNYRTQFAQVLNDGSPEELLRLIRERITKLDSGDTTETVVAPE